jgi:transposase-like protein
VISHAVWLYFRFPLSLRMVEEMLLERGMVVSYETVCRWALKFEPEYAAPSQTFCFRVSAAVARATVAEVMVFKGRHFDRSVILLCVRWYLAYNLSLRNLEEMMAERGISVDHATVHRWTIHYAPLLLEQFNRRKRPVTSRWHVDETYIKVRGQWRYLYRAIDSNGDTVEFWFSERRNLAAAKRFLRKALKRHGRPERIVIDGSQTNREAILSCDTTDRLQDRARRKLEPIRIRQSAYLNNRIEQDHRTVKRRVRPMLGFKSMASARAILGGIEMVHMMRKGQAKYARNSDLSLAQQFELLAA